jgi:hypothetical protein
MAGWIIDQVLGAETDLDEETARLGIAELCERGLVILNSALYASVQLSKGQPHIIIWSFWPVDRIFVINEILLTVGAGTLSGALSP